MPKYNLTADQRTKLEALLVEAGYDRDTIEDRVLIHHELAERFGIGQMRITQAGKEFLGQPFGRQPLPVLVSVSGEDQIDVEEAIRKFIAVAESAGANAERRGNQFKIYPRAVND